jgi:hypothetical protein
MRLFITLALALLLSAEVARSKVLIYKVVSIEHYIGAGVDKRVAVRGYIIIDLNTFDISLLRTFVINNQKLMVVASRPSVDIHKIVGAAGRTHTVISISEQDRPPSRFTLTYARGADSLVEWAPGFFEMWPQRMSFSGSSLNITNGALQVEEGVGTMTLLIRDTIEANRSSSPEQVTELLVGQFQQLGYVDITSVPQNIIDLTYGQGAGSFEAGFFDLNDSDPRPGYMPVLPGMTNLVGWTIEGSQGVQWTTKAVQRTTDGDKAVNLQGGAPPPLSTLSTIIPTVPGDDYILSFDASGGFQPFSLGVVSCGSVTNSPIGWPPPGGFPFAFTQDILRFTALASNTVVSFRVTTSAGYGPILDRVSVKALRY